MKKLESLKKYQLEKEMIDIKGGTVGHGTLNGSAYSYDGTLNSTNTGSRTVGINGEFGSYSKTENIYVTDFCGTGTLDGVSINRCWDNVPVLG